MVPIPGCVFVFVHSVHSVHFDSALWPWTVYEKNAYL